MLVWYDCMHMGSANKEARIWRISDGSTIHVLGPHSNAVSCVALAKNDSLVITGCSAPFRCYRTRVRLHLTRPCDVVSRALRSCLSPRHTFKKNTHALLCEHSRFTLRNLWVVCVNECEWEKNGIQMDRMEKWKQNCLTHDAVTSAMALRLGTRRTLLSG